MAVSLFLGHKMVASLSLSDKVSKPGIRDDILPTKQFIFSDIVGQSKIACISSSKVLLLH